MDNQLNYKQELKAIMDALAESVIDSTDEEILEEVREDGLQPEIIAKQVHETLLNSVKKYRKRNLLKAREKYQDSVFKIQTEKCDLPSTPEERRSLLSRIFNFKPQIQKMVTAQFRDFNELSDADVESLLSQIQKLGILKDIKG